MSNHDPDPNPADTNLDPDRPDTESAADPTPAEPLDRSNASDLSDSSDTSETSDLFEGAVVAAKTPGPGKNSRSRKRKSASAGAEKSDPAKAGSAPAGESKSGGKPEGKPEGEGHAGQGEGDDEDLLDESLPIPTGDQAKAVLEALLFSATSPLSEKRLCNLMNGIGVEALREVIAQVRQDYSVAGRGITIMEVAGGFQLATRQEFADWVFRLHKHRKRSALTPAVIETLAIVAYKQPIVRADIEAIRGVDCGGILRQLQDSGLVEIVGRKEVAGRPPLYGTSDLFLKSFGLRRLSDLPAIEELHTILAEGGGEETSRRELAAGSAEGVAPPTSKTEETTPAAAAKEAAENELEKTADSDDALSEAPDPKDDNEAEGKNEGEHDEFDEKEKGDDEDEEDEFDEDEDEDDDLDEDDEDTEDEFEQLDEEDEEFDEDEDELDNEDEEDEGPEDDSEAP